MPLDSRVNYDISEYLTKQKSTSLSHVLKIKLQAHHTPHTAHYLQHRQYTLQINIS